MDILICLAAKDYKIVRKVIANCRKLLQHPEEKIFIVTNISNKALFSKSWLKKNNTILVDEDDMLEGLSFMSVKESLKSHFQKGTNIYTGWYLQQFLKIGFSLTDYAKEEYLIWDSDTIPLRPIVFKKDGKYLLTVKTENHTPYFETNKRLLGFGKLHDRSFIAEHMPVNVNIMKELIAHINTSKIEGRYWFEKIIYATSGTDEQAFSEFETYGNYCIKYHPLLIETRPLATMRTAGMLFGRGVTPKELNLLAKMEYDTASFELRHIPAFPHNIYNWIERIQLRIYRELGIIKK